jgi:hypothetical protein
VARVWEIRAMHQQVIIEKDYISSVGTGPGGPAPGSPPVYQSTSLPVYLLLYNGTVLQGSPYMRLETTGVSRRVIST